MYRRKRLMVMVSLAMRKALKQLALDEETTVQALGLEALEKLLAERGREVKS